MGLDYLMRRRSQANPGCKWLIANSLRRMREFHAWSRKLLIGKVLRCVRMTQNVRKPRMEGKARMRKGLIISGGDLGMKLATKELAL